MTDIVSVRLLAPPFVLALAPEPVTVVSFGDGAKREDRARQRVDDDLLAALALLEDWQ